MRNPLELRDYQVTGTDQIARALGRVNRVVAVAPTGSGKTIFAANIIVRSVRKQKRSLVLSHRREIINQTVDKLIWAGVEEKDIGVILANDLRARPGAPVQVASIDTLRRRNPPPADLVIVDECHHNVAKTWRSLLDQYPTAKIIGLTATPIWGKGYGLRESYDEMVIVATPSVLIEGGYILAPKMWTVPANMRPDLRRVRTVGGDYNEKDLAEVCDREVLVGDIVRHWHERAGFRSTGTVVFAVNIEHSKHIAECFNAQGVTAEHLDGTMDREKRGMILDRLEVGTTRVVVNVNVLSEGWDMPSVKTLIMARPTKSLVLYLQQAGRVLRPYSDEPAIILDHAGNILEFGPPDFNHPWTLDGLKQRTQGMGVKTCPRCYAVVYNVAKECECGYIWPASDREPPPVRAMPGTVEGNLAEVHRETLDEQREFWEEQCRIAIKNGYKEGWAKYRYKDQYGTWPPSTFRFPERKIPNYTDAQKQRGLDNLRGAAYRGNLTMDWVIERFLTQYGEDVTAFEARMNGVVDQIIAAKKRLALPAPAPPAPAPALLPGPTNASDVLDIDPSSDRIDL